MPQPDHLHPTTRAVGRTSTPTGTPAPDRRPTQLRLVPAEHPARHTPKPLGIANDGSPQGIALRVADARHHIHVQGVTGAGKSTWLANHVLAEADAGRGVVLLDCQGDLARNVLDRLPARVGDRLVILDPAETDAPPAWNVLAAPSSRRPVPPRETTGRDRETAWSAGETGREWAAENVVGVFRRLYAAWWGPRMDDVLRAACLTLVRQPGSALADVIGVLTRPEFRRAILTEHGEPEGLDGFWEGYDALSAGQRNQVAGPVLSRLRSVLSRRFARDLLGSARSTINLADILDGGILIARLPKGEIGGTPRSWSTSAITSCICRSGWTTRSPRPAATGSPSCWRTSTSRNYPPMCGTPWMPTPATKSSSPSRRMTRPNWRGMWHPISTNVISPGVPRSRSSPAPCTTDTTCPRSRWPRNRCRRRHVGVAPRAARLGANPGNSQAKDGNRTLTPGQSSGHPAGHSPASGQATYEWPAD